MLFCSVTIWNINASESDHSHTFSCSNIISPPRPSDINQDVRQRRMNSISASLTSDIWSEDYERVSWCVMSTQWEKSIKSPLSWWCWRSSAHTSTLGLVWWWREMLQLDQGEPISIRNSLQCRLVPSERRSFSEGLSSSLAFLCERIIFYFMKMVEKRHDGGRDTSRERRRSFLSFSASFANLLPCWNLSRWGCKDLSLKPTLCVI